MYKVKVYIDKHKQCTVTYDNIETILADIANKRICVSRLSDEIADRFKKCELKRIACSSENNGIPDDFEAQFTDNICVSFCRA